MTKREALRQTQQEHTLLALGFTREEAVALRRISLTLHRWHELECGGGNQYGDWAIERADNGDGPPFMVRHIYSHDGHGKAKTIRTRIPDRETGAKKRLAKILAARNDRHQVRQTACVRCGLDIEGFADEPNVWRDRGNNRHCPDGQSHAMNVSADAFDQLSTYIQTDPRGAALYILRPGDVPDGKDVESYYTRGVCVY